jgi:hypothetical protein
MTLDLRRKFKLIDQITEYIRENFFTENNFGDTIPDYDRISILLGRFGIASSNKGYQKDLVHADDQNIHELAEYLLNDKGLSHLFHDKYAIEVLATEEKFSNLNLYLNECFECIKADRKIATLILLRACVEIFIDVSGFKKHYHLGSNIDALIPLMEKDEAFAMFNKNNKQNELKQFLKGIKDFGDDAAHLNGKNAKDFIEKFYKKEFLKLFCILIEHSILKDGIRERNERDIENRVKSIDFSMKEKVITQDTTNDSEMDSDDEIPF